MAGTTTTGSKGPPPPPQSAGPLDKEERDRAHVATLQRDLNRHLRQLGATAKLAEDGEWDDDTAAAFRDMCRILGIEAERSVRTYRLISGAAASRTPEEEAKARSDGADFARALRAKYAVERAGDAVVIGGEPLPQVEREAAYVAALQRDLNRHLERLNSGERLAVDGSWDEHTERAFRQVCKVLGLAPERTVRTFRLISGAAAAPTPEERRRAAGNAGFAERLKAENARRFGTGPRRTLGRSMPRAERQASYVAALQRDLNRHLISLGSPTVLGIDGQWGDHTELAFRRVCRALGIEAERSRRALRIIAGTLVTRTPDELERAKTDGAAFVERLREEFVNERASEPPPKEDGPARPADRPARDRPERPGASRSSMAAAIRAHGGRYERIIIREARRNKIPVWLLCAVCEHESGFSNVFGHDRVRNPIKSPDGSNLRVTEQLYRKYLHHRKQGLGYQGVGPMQLTWFSYQDEADRLGGCWKPGPNIAVGARLLRDNIARQGGIWAGLKAYNGGPNPQGAAKEAAERYATKVEASAKKWRGWLEGTTSAGEDAPEPGGRRSRTFKVTVPAMHGTDVKRFQRLLNERFKDWRIPKRIAVDGDFGPETLEAARHVAFALGLAREKVVTAELRALIRRPSQRTARQRERAARRKRFRAKLREQHRAAGPGSPLLRGHKAPKPPELRRIIVRAHQHGLIVTSTNDGGHTARSYHYQDRAVDFGLPGPLIGTAKGKSMMVRFQRELARNPRRFAELFGPDTPSSVKNGVKQYPGASVVNSHQDHVHVAI